MALLVKVNSYGFSLHQLMVSVVQIVDGLCKAWNCVSGLSCKCCAQRDQITPITSSLGDICRLVEKDAYIMKICALPECNDIERCFDLRKHTDDKYDKCNWSNKHITMQVVFCLADLWMDKNEPRVAIVSKDWMSDYSLSYFKLLTHVPTGLLLT